MLHARTLTRDDGSTFDRIWSDSTKDPNIEAVAVLYINHFLQGNCELDGCRDDEDDNA